MGPVHRCLIDVHRSISALVELQEKLRTQLGDGVRLYCFSHASTEGRPNLPHASLTSELLRDLQRVEELQGCVIVVFIDAQEVSAA